MAMLSVAAALSDRHDAKYLPVELVYEPAAAKKFNTPDLYRHDFPFRNIEMGKGGL